MTNIESERFGNCLRGLYFSEHDIKVIKVILQGDGVYNQEDIIDVCEHNTQLLKKLGWYRKTKKALKDAGLRLNL